MSSRRWTLRPSYRRDGSSEPVTLNQAGGRPEVRSGSCDLSRAAIGPNLLRSDKTEVNSVDCTEASKSATPRSSDIREGVGYSGMQRGVWSLLWWCSRSRPGRGLIFEFVEGLKFAQLEAARVFFEVHAV